MRILSKKELGRWCSIPQHILIGWKRLAASPSVFTSVRAAWGGSKSEVLDLAAAKDRLARQRQRSNERAKRSLQFARSLSKLIAEIQAGHWDVRACCSTSRCCSATHSSDPAFLLAPSHGLCKRPSQVWTRLFTGGCVAHSQAGPLKCGSPLASSLSSHCPSRRIGLTLRPVPARVRSPKRWDRHNWFDGARAIGRQSRGAESARCPSPQSARKATMLPQNSQRSA